MDGEDFVKLCGLLRKHKLYSPVNSAKLSCSIEGTLMYWESGKSSLRNKELRFWYRACVQ